LRNYNLIDKDYSNVSVCIQDMHHSTVRFTSVSCQILYMCANFIMIFFGYVHVNCTTLLFVFVLY